MHNFSCLRVMSMGGDFFQNMNLHDNGFGPLSRLLTVSFLPNFNML